MRLLRAGLAAAAIVLLGAGPAMAVDYTPGGTVTVAPPQVCIPPNGGSKAITLTGSDFNPLGTGSATITATAASGWKALPNPVTSFTGGFTSTITVTHPATYTFTTTVVYTVQGHTTTQTFTNTVRALPDSNAACTQVLGEKITNSPTAVAGEKLPKTGAGNAIPLAIAGGVLVLGGGTLLAGQATVRRRRH